MLEGRGPGGPIRSPKPSKKKGGREGGREERREVGKKLGTATARQDSTQFEEESVSCICPQSFEEREEEESEQSLDAIEGEGPPHPLPENYNHLKRACIYHLMYSIFQTCTYTASAYQH